MKLGIGSYTFTWAIGVTGHEPPDPLTALDLLEKAQRLNVDVVQYCDNLPLTRLCERDLDLLIETSREYGITLEVGTRGIGTENVLANLRLAQRVEAPFVRFVVDAEDDRPSPDEVVERIKPMIPAFSDAGVMFAIENHDRFTTDDLTMIVEALGPDKCGICLDTVNSMGGLEMPTKVVPALAPYTVNLHVKDFQIERVPSQMGFSIIGCAVGKGRLDVPWLLCELHKAGRDVNAIIELWTPMGTSVTATIAREEGWARESVRYMRGLWKGQNA